MRIVHITTFDYGGAGNAAVRLHLGLLKLGVDSRMIVLKKKSGIPTISSIEQPASRWISLLKKIMRKIGLPLTKIDRKQSLVEKYRADYEMFSFAETPYEELAFHPYLADCHVINLHWVANFLDYKTFFKQLSRPVVWTLHDMNPFQGSFHYKEDETRNSTKLGQLDAEQYELKKIALGTLRPELLSIATPSRWLMNESKQSALLGRFDHHTINNGIDIEIFKTADREASRTAISLGTNKVVILFVSEFVNNIRKGFEYILSLLQDPDIRLNCYFLAVGHTEEADRIPGIQYLGVVKEQEKMSVIYNAADIFLLPSREDNLPNVMIESLCCGTPVVGFKVGGIREVVQDGVNGYLSDAIDLAGLKAALLNCIQNLPQLQAARQEIASVARKDFNVELQAAKYKALYQSKTSVQ